MKFGISYKYKRILNTIFEQYLTTDIVIIYGSRVKNTYTNISDVDLVIKGNTLNRHQLSELIDDIEESNFPYLCDVQLLDKIKNLHLKEHIDRLGKVFYKKENNPKN